MTVAVCFCLNDYVGEESYKQHLFIAVILELTIFQTSLGCGRTTSVWLQVSQYIINITFLLVSEYIL